MRAYNFKARGAAAVFLTIVVLALWWVSGFDFNTRGNDSMIALLSTLAAFLMGATCPVFDNEPTN